jgi:hypothetical protein
VGRTQEVTLLKKGAFIEGNRVANPDERRELRIAAEASGTGYIKEASAPDHYRFHPRSAPRSTGGTDRRFSETI